MKKYLDKALLVQMEVSISPPIIINSTLVKRGGYIYKGNCYEIFDKYFMESNPFFDLCTDLTDVKGTELEIEGSFFGTAYGGMR